jgi:hypothetical protein
MTPRSGRGVALLGFPLLCPFRRDPFNEACKRYCRTEWKGDTRFPTVQIIDARACKVQDHDDRLAPPGALLRKDSVEAFARNASRGKWGITDSRRERRFVLCRSAGAAVTSYQTAGTNGDGATRHLRA